MNLKSLNSKSRRKERRKDLRALWTPKFVRKLIRRKHQTVW